MGMKIALIAHDRKKEEMVNFVIAYETVFEHHQLYATGTTGTRIMESTKLNVHRFMSGPLGGDQQIGALVATNEMDLIIFLRDPLMAQPHEPDIIALFASLRRSGHSLCYEYCHRRDSSQSVGPRRFCLERACP